MLGRMRRDWADSMAPLVGCAGRKPCEGSTNSEAQHSRTVRKLLSARPGAAHWVPGQAQTPTLAEQHYSQKPSVHGGINGRAKRGPLKTTNCRSALKQEGRSDIRDNRDGPEDCGQ